MWSRVILRGTSFAIIGTNRQIQYEADNLLCSENTFEIRLNQWAGITHSKMYKIPTSMLKVALEVRDLHHTLPLDYSESIDICRNSNKYSETSHVHCRLFSANENLVEFKAKGGLIATSFA
jgi:hypothetical protein